MHRAHLRSIHIAEKTFSWITRRIRPWMTEKQVADLIRDKLKELGAEKEAFRIIVASGERSALIHGFASDKLIKKKDLVMLDFGAYYKGYRSDITRTFVFGKPDRKQRKLYDVVRLAQKAAIKMVRHGARCSDVDRAARTIIEKAGYGKNFRHTTGHGVRRKIHEPPRIGMRNRQRLKAGQVITIEPGIYIDGWGGVRIEDMVLVTKKGCKILTRGPYRMEI